MLTTRVLHASEWNPLSTLDDLLPITSPSPTQKQNYNYNYSKIPLTPLQLHLSVHGTPTSLNRHNIPPIHIHSLTFTQNPSQIHTSPQKNPSMAFTCTATLATFLKPPPLFPLQTNPLRSQEKLAPISCKKKKNNAIRTLAYSPPKPLKTRLAEGEKLYGIFLLSFSPVVAEIVGYAGYDFAVVDMEHGPGDFMAALPLLHALHSTGTPAILRIPDTDPVLTKKAMDLGPQGIMFPMIDGPKAARKAVSYCRYPPKGVRGAAHPIVRASRYGINTDYLDEYENEVLVMCQVESEEGVKKIDEIASVEGVDCIQMGPTDLAADMGFLGDVGNKRVREMMFRAEKGVLGVKNGGAYLAGFAMPYDPPDEMQKRGYHMVSGSVDIGLIRDAALGDVRKHKEGWNGLKAGDVEATGDVGLQGKEEEEAEKEYA